MAELYNLARVTTATTGTGTITLSSTPVSGFLNFSNAGVQDGDYVTYAIKDGANSEIGRGLFTLSGLTLTRNVIRSTNSNNAISLSGTAEVFITAAGEDIGSIGALVVKNLTVTASVAASALTVNIKTLAAADPSATDEIVVGFRSATEESGVYVKRTLRAASSIVISSGSTMGTANSTPFALYLVLFDDAGTLRIGLINCLSGKSIFPIGAYGVASSTAEGGGGAADSAQVFYTGTAATAKPYITLARLTWASGLATAGTWSAPPTRIELVNEYGFRFPGTRFNTQLNVYTSTVTTTSTSFTSTGITVAITPTSAANLIAVGFAGAGDCDTVNNTVFYDADRASTSICGVYGRDALSSAVKATSGAGTIPQSFVVTDAPASTSGLTYTLKWKVTSGTATLGARNGGGNTAVTTFYVEEIQV